MVHQRSSSNDYYVCFFTSLTRRWWLIMLALLMLSNTPHRVEAFAVVVSETSPTLSSGRRQYRSVPLLPLNDNVQRGGQRRNTGVVTTSTTIRASTTSTPPSMETSDDVTTKTSTWFSPCKINLFLRILRKRPDGYHDLASLFQAIGFGDTLEMTPISSANSDIFTCNMEGVPTDSSNLVLRAIQLMRDKTGNTDQYYNVNLIKQCPAQAGLGGGSANAATAMWATNELMGNPATIDQMVEWSGALGSDITFFLSRGTAYCTGRGEIIQEIDPPLAPGTKVCIVKPSIGLSTPAVFKALEYDKLSTIDPDAVLLPAFFETSPTMDQVPDEYFINDLEYPAFKCVPELKVLKEQLLRVKGFYHVMMSGSGTSIFCLGEPEDMDAFRQTFMESRDDVQVFFSEFISRPEGSWFERP